MQTRRVGRTNDIAVRVNAYTKREIGIAQKNMQKDIKSVQKDIKSVQAHMQKEIEQLMRRKKQIENTCKKVSTWQAASKVAPLLDIKTLRGQYKTFKKAAAAKYSRAGGELTVFMRLRKEMDNAADRIEKQLDLAKTTKNPKDFDRWATKARHSNQKCSIIRPRWQISVNPFGLSITSKQSTGFQNRHTSSNTRRVEQNIRGFIKPVSTENTPNLFVP